MKRLTINVQAQVGAKSEPTQHTLEIRGEAPCLTDVLRKMARTEWGRVLFDQDETTLRPGQLVILNNRAVQPWETDDILVADGSILSIVPFVAGG